MTRISWIVLAVLLMFSISMSGQQPGASGKAAPQGSQPASTAFAAYGRQNAAGPALQNRYPRYVLRAGDTVEISFRLSPEFDQTLTVQPDGFVTLRDAGDVHVQGLTTQELTQEIRKVYGRILHEPMITVVLKDFEKPYFIASGEVGKPGKYELRGQTTLVEAIAMAGGFNEAAKHSEVYLFRRVSDDAVEVKRLNVKRMLAKHNLNEDVILHPGDMFHVPQNMLSKLKGFVIPKATIGPRIDGRP
jgi:polysaccharide export outer membrane protein